MVEAAEAVQEASGLVSVSVSVSEVLAGSEMIPTE